MLWGSGGYGYDGAGNVTQIGHGHYLYDGVSRLTSSAVETNAVDAGSGNSLASQTTAYDALSRPSRTARPRVEASGYEPLVTEVSTKDREPLSISLALKGDLTQSRSEKVQNIPCRH